MLSGTAERVYESDIPRDVGYARAWRPFPADMSDLLCVDSGEGEIGPWIHERFAITLVKPRAVIRLESRRSIHLETEAVLLVPALHMYAVRSLDVASGAGLTLLVEHPDRVASSGSPALVTRAGLVASTRELVADLARSVRPITGAAGVGSLVESLVSESTAVALARTSGAATPLLPLRDYLRAHLTECVPTATLAELSGLTESHFIRAFHHEFGLPPHAYHMRLRLAHACELLARGESVSTVAYDCGFADQSHLSRKFKEVYNVAPGAWASGAGDRPARARNLHRQRVPKTLMRRPRANQEYGKHWLR